MSKHISKGVKCVFPEYGLTPLFKGLMYVYILKKNYTHIIYP